MLPWSSRQIGLVRPESDCFYVRGPMVLKPPAVKKAVDAPVANALEMNGPTSENLAPGGLRAIQCNRTRTVIRRATLWLHIRCSLASRASRLCVSHSLALLGSALGLSTQGASCRKEMARPSYMRRTVAIQLGVAEAASRHCKPGIHTYLNRRY